MAKKIPPIRDLLKNPNIDESILDAYYSLEPTLNYVKEKLSKEKFKNNVVKATLFQPFGTFVYGAYLMPSEWTDINEERRITECSYREFTLLMKKYATGFLYGYYNFERDVLETKSKIFGTEINKSQVIYDHISLGYPKAFENSMSHMSGMGNAASQMPSLSFFSEINNLGVKRGKFYRAWYIILENHKVFEGYFTSQLTSENKPQTTFTPKAKNLKDWILSDYIDIFLEIEKELFNREYIDSSYKWQMGKGKGKVRLIDFLTVIIEYKYFKHIVHSIKIKDSHKRQFISERYGLGKFGLAESVKKHKPTFDIASIPFAWITKPE